MAEADIFVDVDIPGLTPVPDTSVGLGIEPVVGKPTPADDGSRATIEQITKDRDAWKARAEGGDSKTLTQLAEERRAREAAEARAGQAAEGELRAKWNESVSQHDQLAAGVIQMREVIEVNKAALANAHADENLSPAERGRRIAEAHTKLSLAAADLRTLEQGEADAKNQIEHLKRTIQTARAAPPPEPAKPQAQPEPPKETSDQWIARFPQKTQEWLRSHQDFVSNTALNKKLVTFAEDYHDQGGKPLHDDNFIAALNKRFGFGGDDVKNDVPVLEVDTNSNHVSTRAAAPPSRNNAPTGQNGNSVTPTGRVRLSGEERDTALAMFPDLEHNEAVRRYARNKAEAIRDGKYAR